MLDVFARTMKALLLGKPAEELAFQGTVPDALLMPLTAIRRCTTFTRLEAEAVCCPNVWDEQEGLRIFCVRYAVDGHDTDGNAVSVEAEGAVGLLCGRTGGESREMLNIRDAEPCPIRSDGSVQRQGWLQRSLRRWLRRKRREGISEGALSLLGDVVEFVLEVIFDG